MDILKYFHDNANEQFCAALGGDLSYKSFNMLHSPYRRLGFTKDRLYMSTLVMYFHKPTVLKNIFNKEIWKHQEAGLIDFWIRNYTDDRNVKSAKMPSKLKIESISSIFIICAITYFISFVVFVLEVISVKFHYVKFILDYLTF